MLSISGFVSGEVAAPPAAKPAEGTPAAPDRLGEIFRFLCWVALYGMVAVTAVRAADDWDLWWHLRTGEWIVENGWVPQTDPFSAYGQDKTWVAYSWLFEIGLYSLHHGIGLLGVVLFRLALTLAVAVAFHRLISKRTPSFFAAGALFAAAAVVCLPLLSERPWLFTILFTTLTLDVVLDLREGKTSWLAWTLPLIFLLWANLHIQFVYGLFLLGLACIAPLFDRLLGRSGAPAGWKLVGLSAACAAATLINPYHVRLYGVVLEYGTHTDAFNLVQELSAPDFRDLCSWVALGLALSAAFALGRRSRLFAFDVLLLAAAAYFAFRARRDLWFLCLASLAILARAVPAGAADRFNWTMGRRIVLAALILSAATATTFVRRVTPEHMEQIIARRFPVEAAGAVERAGCAGPLYNSFDWGGYLIWRLPQHPVAIDGRTNLHGDERLQRSFDTWRGAKGWHDDPELCAAGVILADAGGPLASLLRQDARFRVFHEDEVAIVFLPASSPAHTSLLTRK